jgi:hypothetical protein
MREKRVRTTAAFPERVLRNSRCGLKVFSCIYSSHFRVNHGLARPNQESPISTLPFPNTNHGTQYSRAQKSLP